MVGAEGFEPSTSWSRTRRSTRLSHAPTNQLFSGTDDGVAPRPWKLLLTVS
jgi:hypothetical protein